MAVVLFTPLAFLLLWVGLRWPFRRALVVSILIGLAADVLFDVILTRNR